MYGTKSDDQYKTLVDDESLDWINLDEEKFVENLGRKYQWNHKQVIYFIIIFLVVFLKSHFVSFKRNIWISE